MYDFVTLQEHQTAQQLLCKASDKFQRKPSEVVALDELVEVHAKKLSRDAEVTTEIEALGKVHHAVLVLRILNAQLG